MVTNYHVIKGANEVKVGWAGLGGGGLACAAAAGPLLQACCAASAQPAPSCRAPQARSTRPLRAPPRRARLPPAQVTLNDHSSYTARVVGGDSGKDIAVLRLSIPKHKAEQLQPVTLGTSAALRVGQSVFTIGNPFGLDHTLSQVRGCRWSC